MKSELYLNLINIANMIKPGWGLDAEVPFSYRRAVTSATYNPAGNGGAGVWNYNFNSGTLDGQPVVANDTPISRWQVSAGIKIKF